MGKNKELDFKELKKMIGQGELKEVFELLHSKLDNNNNFNYLISQSRRYHDLEREIYLNLIQRDNANVEKSKITQSLLFLIDELEANEQEDQKYMTDEDDKTLGTKVQFQPIESSKTPKSITNDLRTEDLVLRFLKEFNLWYFSPLRINKWGSQQSGFEDLDRYSSKVIKMTLEKLFIKGKVKKTTSKKGNPIYKINQQKGSE